MNYIFDQGGMRASDPLPVHVPGLDLPAFDPTSPHHWRKSAKAMLEWMFDRQMEIIAQLDLMDGDPDLEPYLADCAGDDREGGDVQDQPHDPDDGADVSWPALGPHVLPFGLATEDDEPSLAAPEPGYAAAAYEGSSSRADRPYGAARPLGTQETWARGCCDDSEDDGLGVEDEHDGAEPENEHGPSWPEAASRRGCVCTGCFDDGEDRENSLSLPESINQATRWIETRDWHVADGEADYAGRFGKGREADEEPSSGNSTIRTAKGIEIDDPEGLEDGLDGIESGWAEMPAEGEFVVPLPFNGSGNVIGRRLLAGVK